MLSEPFIFKKHIYKCFLNKNLPEYALLPNFVCEILIIMVELTNNLRKLVASLDNARARRDNGLFVAEGTKCVLDTLHNFSCRYLFATSAWIERHHAEIGAVEPVTVKRADMERMSHLSTPPEVVAVYDIPSNELDESEFRHNLTIVLDRVQDPGNLGTIMRIADWFGIRQIICSHDTVDVYNPKVVQATMGAISRVKVCYESLVDLLGRLDDVPVFGTFLDGDDIYSSELSGCGMIVFGNEGQGISPDVERLVSSRLTIPSFPPGAVTSESLNVGMAAAVTVAEFRRRIY